MKLVITYNVTDGFSYGFDAVECIEYESIEKFQEDFVNALDKTRQEKKSEFSIGNITFDVESFSGWLEDSETIKDFRDDILPEIQLLEDWFANKSKN